MKINFLNAVEDLVKGIHILSQDLNIEISENGIPVEVENRQGKIYAAYNGNRGVIKYEDKSHFFRALGLFVERFQEEKSFEIQEEPQFSKNGAMFDVSRNAVLTVDSIKLFIRKMALMGLNMFMLYTEDTYTLENRPYFGYMRGRYSESELKECDDFADVFGIEVIPCIQTLAHLSTALRWETGNDIKDTEDILLAGNDKTYEFIEEMIQTASRPFRSKRIHIGMDEAHNLGLGKYLRINGYRRRFDIMNEHLERVRSIAQKHGLSPMIWSDMYFRLASENNDYYDAKAIIPDDVAQRVPKDVELVYWDYYHHSESEYISMIEKHKKLGCNILFAGGIWTWNGNEINYAKTFDTTNSALKACKDEGVKEVLATIWGDNGAETNIFSSLLGLQLFAEHGYSGEIDNEKLKKRFRFCTGCDMDAFLDFSSFDKFPEANIKNIDTTANPSKYILWQDILLGLFDRNLSGIDLPWYYVSLEKRMKKYLEESNEWKFIFEVPYYHSKVLALKCDMGIRLKSCYNTRDLEGLKNILNNELPELYERVGELRIAHRKQWFKTYKPFGWECIDIRYGGLLARIASAIARLSDYISGNIVRIEELEEERLFFDGELKPDTAVLGRCNNYSKIISASPL